MNRQPPRPDKSRRTIKQLKERKQALEQVRSLRDDLYVDMKKGLISAEQYPALKARYDREEKELLAAIEGLKAEAEAQNENAFADGSYLDTFIQYQTIKKLTRETIVDLVENIYLDRNGNVTVEFSFGDDFGGMPEYIEPGKTLHEDTGGFA